MRVAVIGDPGFVGHHLSQRLLRNGDTVIQVALPGEPLPVLLEREQAVPLIALDLDDVFGLARAMSGCEAAVLLAGIDRELGDQTFEKVFVDGTANVVRAAREAQIKKIVDLSFLLARPDCGSPFHETRYESEVFIQNSGLDYTILKAGAIFGRGDHLLEQIARAVNLYPFFLLVGRKGTRMKPLAVEDLVEVMIAALEGRMSRKTISVVGPEVLNLREIVWRVGQAFGLRPRILPAPRWLHYGMAWFFERSRTLPLAARAQVKILSEPMTRGLLDAEGPPEDLLPKTRLGWEEIRRALPGSENIGFRHQKPSS